EAAIAAAAFDPRELERVEERLFALRAAARKHGVAVADLPQLRDRMTAELVQLSSGEERLAALRLAAAETRARYDKAAAELSARRKRTARSLERAVAAELPALRLERAEFMVAIASDPARPAETGIDEV